MSTYMLLLRGEAVSREREDLSPGAVRAILERYIAWSTRLAADGRFVAADKLRPSPGCTLRPDAGAPRVIDGPFSEAKEIVAGYFIIDVAGLEEATEVARSCPHLEFGGTIEVREIEPRVGWEMAERNP